MGIQRREKRNLERESRKEKSGTGIQKRGIWNGHPEKRKEKSGTGIQKTKRLKSNLRSLRQELRYLDHSIYGRTLRRIVQLSAVNYSLEIRIISILMKNLEKS